MTDRQIIFRDEMVRAILDGRKSQTRRPIMPGNSLVDGRGTRRWPEGMRWPQAWVDPGPSPAGNFGHYLRVPTAGATPRIYPRVQPGDRLWVREAWAWSGDDSVPETERVEDGEVWYRATPLSDSPAVRWRPSIHMPRWASRITLPITAVRVERLQEITEEDAIAEGVPASPYVMADGSIDEAMSVPARGNFAHLWDGIYAAQGLGWDVNPWVWVVEWEEGGVRT